MIKESPLSICKYCFIHIDIYILNKVDKKRCFGVRNSIMNSSLKQGIFSWLYLFPWSLSGFLKMEKPPILFLWPTHTTSFSLPYHRTNLSTWNWSMYNPEEIHTDTEEEIKSFSHLCLEGKGRSLLALQECLVELLYFPPPNTPI